MRPDMTSVIVFVLSLAASFALGGLVGSVTSVDQANKSQIEQCRRQHNVYECRVMAVPVTPDGQPLDMSDPFHGEDE